MRRLSAHFVDTEFACRHCGKIRVSDRLVDALEVMRAAGYPRGLIVRSGYRCPHHNEAVGGAATSQHLTGNAADVDPCMALGEVLGLKVFTGIGWRWLTVARRRQPMVTHVDVRAGRSVDAPAVWEYR